MKIESSILIPTLAEISIGPSITRSFMDKKPDSFNNLIVSSGKLGNKSKEKGLLFDLVLKYGLESGLKFKYTISYLFQYFNNANNSD
jgi:hypothetical protein